MLISGRSSSAGHEVLALSFGYSALGQGLNPLLLLSCLVHPFQLLLHGTLLSLRGKLSCIRRLRSRWLTADVRGKRALLSLLLKIVLLSCFIHFVSLSLPLLVESFVDRRSLGRAQCICSVLISSCDIFANLWGKSALFKLPLILGLFRFFMPL